MFEHQDSQVLVLILNKDRNRGSIGAAEAEAQLCESSGQPMLDLLQPENNINYSLPGQLTMTTPLSVQPWLPPPSISLLLNSHPEIPQRKEEGQTK